VSIDKISLQYFYLPYIIINNNNNTLFHPMITTIYIALIGVLAARNNPKVKNARQPVERKDS